METTLKTCIFHAICSILELETAISTVFATVLSSNLSFSHGICNILVVENIIFHGILKLRDSFRVGVRVGAGVGLGFIQGIEGSF